MLDWKGFSGLQKPALPYKTRLIAPSKPMAPAKLMPPPLISTGR